MRVRLLFRKARQIYRDEGAGELARRTKDYLLDVRKGSYQKDRRVDIEERFDMISPYVSDDDSSLLDIGCAEGELTARFYELGLFSVGVDTSVTRISAARKNRETTDGPGFMLYELTPDNIGKLPAFDVVLLLTVYHHWCDAYGFEAADEMLRESGRRSGTVVFEPPGRKLDGVEVGGSTDLSVREYYTQYLDAVFDQEVEIKYAGTASYMEDSSREDPVFVIDCSTYE